MVVVMYDGLKSPLTLTLTLHDFNKFFANQTKNSTNPNDVRAHTYTTTHSSSTRVSALISGSQTHTEVLKGVTVTNSP